eukprot:GSChrysophyteH2.ASY1.ANO1.1758.1 assembled CDS
MNISIRLASRLVRIAVLNARTPAASFHTTSTNMPPKRKVEDTAAAGDLSPPANAKSSPKKPKKSKNQETEAEDKAGDDLASPSPAAKKEKVVKAKVVQADYMPSSYPKDKYDEASHLAGDAHKIVSWNVAGISACMEKGFREYVKAENPDILVLQETKLQEANVPKFDSILSEMGYAYRYWSCSTAKKGYAGTALFSKTKPLRVIYGLGSTGAFNEEGRTVSAEFDSFHIVNCYVPNSGAKLERLEWRKDIWDTSMLAHLKYLESGGGDGVILTGDLNVAHEEIDLKNWKTNKNKTAGFCDEEREGMSNFLAAGFDDSYRRLHPEGTAYTYYGMRFNSYATNTGWRLDYFITSEVLRPRVEKVLTRQEVYGASDHCPIGLILTK